MADERDSNDEAMITVFELARPRAPRGQSSSTLPSDEALVFVQGENTSGDAVYAYIQLPVDRVEDLRERLVTGEQFVPSELGTVIAAGRGQPTEEVKAEIAEHQSMIYYDPPTLRRPEPRTRSSGP